MNTIPFVLVFMVWLIINSMPLRSERVVEWLEEVSERL